MREHPGDLLSARLDGELAPDAEAAVDEHVAACAACRRDLDALARTRTLLRGLPQVEAPPDL
ncbi:MAG TPA: zf-HC2 domain-containing protein, partial [Acidimicrobiales bacterium]